MNDFENNKPDISKFSFPHLDDTAFPLLDNVDVYEYKNDFDYERWTDGTKIHLCNVLWNNDYKDVVKFENNAARDKYFNEIDSHIVDLTTAFHVAPDSTIKVPIPYQVATRYNYMYVDLPIMTSEEQPINYEKQDRTQRFYYFINGLMQNAPSSTTLVIQLDSWTTFINNVDIPYMVLKRGHAPMASIDVETYLANPIENNEFLLAPDFNFSNDNGIVRTSDFVPINNQAKYIMFATTVSLQQIKAQQYPTAIISANTPATFENKDTRNGYQLIVNDYEWSIGDYDYNGMYTETTSYQSANNLIPNGTTMIAVSSENAGALFANMSTIIPFFYKTIKACFMVDETMFTKGQSFVFCNTQCYEVLPAQDSLVQALTFAKSDFKYNAKYANITKLYTSPYSIIEVTDNNGNTKQFKIENTSNVEIRKATSLAFPYISIQTYLTGINGNETNSYSWKKLDGTTVSKNIDGADFGEYLWSWDIPTYALYVKGYNEYKATNYPNQYINRYNAIAEYTKTVGADNTQYQNAVDSADNTKTMTNNSATTENTNALNMASTIQTNNTASANTAKSNAYASANTAQTNTNNQADTMITNTGVDCARNTTVTTRNNTANTDVNDENVQFNNISVSNANYQNAAITGIENQQTNRMAVANSIGALGNAVTSGTATGTPLGAVGATIGAVANIAASGVSTWATTSANNSETQTSIDCNNGQRATTNTHNGSLTTIGNVCAVDNTNTNNEAATTITANTAATMKTNASNTCTTEKANADRTNTTSIDNTDRTYNTSVANANRTKTNTDTNAQLNRNVTVANSRYTRQQNIDNAQLMLEQKRISNQQQYYSQRLAAPLQYGADSGDPTLDAFARRGLQVKLRTQSDGNIAQTGDLMLRYGYAFNQVWDVDSNNLTYMKHFTYWECDDIWINTGAGTNQDSQNDIKRAFQNGVTVWSNPEEIGKVSIYDNWN